MQQRVISTSEGHRAEGCGEDGELVNRFLSHLVSRAFSLATVRAYAYDLLNFLRFRPSGVLGSATWWPPICSTTWTGSNSDPRLVRARWCGLPSIVALRRPR